MKIVIWQEILSTKIQIISPPLGQNPLGTENDQKELGKRSLAQTSLLKIASSLVVTKETATSQARLGQHLSGGLF